ncbi:MAG: RNA polymerase sigma-70 factor [Hyphomicrobiales bacterium]
MMEETGTLAWSNGHEVSAMSSALAAFEAERPALFGVAYRMLGSASEAEDILQEAWLRWQATDASSIRSPHSFLVTMVTRLALDQLRSARARREQYVGPWLPEPVAITSSGRDDPETAAETFESISLAFLVVLERLAPIERAVFLLHDVFDYGYPEIAEIVGKSETACRQVLSRARRRVAEGRPRFAANNEARRRLTERFVRVAEEGDVASMVDLLTEDITVYTDGGGKVAAALNPLHGRDAILRFWLHFSEQYDITLRSGEVNGGPGVYMYLDGRLDSVFVLEGDGERIHEVYVVRNPDKLAAIRRELEPGGLEQPRGDARARHVAVAEGAGDGAVGQDGPFE